MKTKLLLILFFCLPVLAQKDTIKMGVYITNLYDFNLEENSFTTEFWLWNISNVEKKISPEIINTKNYSFLNFSSQKKINLDKQSVKQ